MPRQDIVRGKGISSMQAKSGSSSGDEFPEIELVVRRHRHDVQSRPGRNSRGGDKGDVSAATETPSGAEHCVREGSGKPSTTVKATPLRRRKLAQSQTIDGSLLKPWSDTKPSAKKDARMPKNRNAHARVRGASVEADSASGDASEPVIITSRHVGSRAISSSTMPSLPSTKKGTKKIDEGKNTQTKNRQASGKETKHSALSDESDERSEVLRDISKLSDGEVSEFVSISDSGTESWNSDSEPLSTSPARHPMSPTIQRFKPQRALFKDPVKKTAPSNEQTQATIKDPTKRAPRQRGHGNTTLNALKASHPGNIEDAFQKLRIFNEDSEPDEPSSKAKKPTMEPTTPKKTLQTSPFKTPKIPTSPWKPEHKEFWDPEVNFAWIDEHSPDKLKSPGKQQQDAPGAKAEAKRKYAISPEKRDAKKAFDAVKEELARSFLQELDDRITDGRLALLTRDTGGLRITWSKTLLTTAGRAHWKCKALSTIIQHADGTSSTRESSRQHHARIELASKVLANEADLLNTVAHEFCHLAVFILNGKPKTAHGPEFKTWGRKCGQVFAHRGIEVTTKHSYEIEYKYIWRCAGCAGEVKRHSRSVDPVRQRCGACRGYLEQVKPVPRGRGNGSTGPASGTSADAGASGKDAAASTKKKPSAWQEFMAKEMKSLSRTSKGMSFKERMAIVSAKWNELSKEQKEQLREQSVRELEGAVEVLQIVDEGGGDGGADEEDGEEVVVQEIRPAAKGTYDIFS
ncbi:hypothetical protein AAE478_010519 [Parahypoxylon ruwenzoriense]